MRWIILFIVLFTLGCINRNSDEPQDTIEDQPDSNTPITLELDFELESLPDSLYQVSSNEWDGFQELEVSVQELIGLNLRSIDFYLDEIQEDIEGLENNLPEEVEITAIKSRLSLLRAYSNRSLFYVKNYQQDSLQLTLNDFFEAYNGLIQRVVVKVDNDNSTIQDSLSIE